MNSRHFWGPCYYCICTACSVVFCPFKHKLYGNCYRCQERGTRSPRLQCDFFNHYLKHRRFRFRRRHQSESGTQRAGTYVLNVRGVCFVGRWSELRPIADRLGGELKPLGAIDFLTGEH